MKDLTLPQSKVLRFISEFLTAMDRPPTIAEIQSAFDWASRTTVYAHLRRLERKGYLERYQSVELKRYAIRLTTRAQLFLNRKRLNATSLGSRFAGDLVAVESNSIMLRELIPESRQGDFLYHIQTNRYASEGFPPGTAVVMRQAAEPPKEGFALIRFQDSLRFRKYKIDGPVLKVDDASIPPIPYPDRKSESYIVATVVAALHIHLWL